ncbi:MAG: phosphatase PAP2 family protein [Ruminococcus sp.]|nr:phosphatase PAP2 family protein [Ruminococcus sp.]
MIQQFDFAILDWIQSNLRCDFLDFLMPLVTLYAEHGILLIGIGVVLLIFRSRRVCGEAVLTGLTSGLLIGNIALKNQIARTRPCWINTDVSMLVSVPTDYSFPSGHTLHCFIAATVLMYYDKRLGMTESFPKEKCVFSYKTLSLIVNVSFESPSNTHTSASPFLYLTIPASAICPLFLTRYLISVIIGASVITVFSFFKQSKTEMTSFSSPLSHTRN